MLVRQDLLALRRDFSLSLPPGFYGFFVSEDAAVAHVDRGISYRITGDHLFLPS